MAMEGVPELWAGVECTINRVGDDTFDQCALTGHASRPDDLDRIAWLGAKAVRYPVLWERTVREGWAWADERLDRLRVLGVAPIVGLVHHGSGPPDTNLLDDAFAPRLAAYAAQVAARHPWIDAWTPVNEPGTTARFSALYGLWYPHQRRTEAFLRALVNECRATALAMREIRAINPAARLVQTEDVGRTSSVPSLRYQADYENERRLLAFDLLAGRVDRAHPLWGHLASHGIGEAELAWFVEHPCPADVIGVNYYLTSDRFLDDRLDRYPPHLHGGNGRDRYVDVEAVRVEEAGITGHLAFFEELSARYRQTIAVTELHLGCTREEQLRWVREGWDAAVLARARGLDVAAVTLWSAFGASDWDKLVTRVTGSYEPGLFDVRAPRPRPTALAHAARELAAHGRVLHPLAAEPGWWRRADRTPEGSRRRDEPDGAPLLVTGARGTLGRAFAVVARTRGLAVRSLSRDELDITDCAAIARVLDELRPWAVINAAGYVRVDDAEREPDRCFRDNVTGPLLLADACARRGIGLVTFSSDLVFSGGERRPYTESATPEPLGTYGASKAEAERAVLDRLPSALVVRTAAFFGPWDERCFVQQVLRRLASRQPVRAAADLVVSPTYVPDLAHATLDLLIDGERGVWHVANAGELTWLDLARRVARMSRTDAALVESCSASELGFAAPRPAFSALASERAQLLRPVDDAIAAFVAAVGVSRADGPLG